MLDRELRVSFMFAICHKLLSLALAGLMLAGGAPHVACNCWDAECRAACEQAGLSFLASTSATKKSPCRCCRDKATCSQPKDPCALASMPGCPCEKFIERTDLSSQVRELELNAAPICAWLSAADQVTSLHLPQQNIAPAAPLRLPPDDPISRAQILRI